MALPFDPERADFSGMDGRKPWLHFDAILHEAFVVVAEEGTEAAAVTAAVTEASGLHATPRRAFRADHPFLFLIRERGTGSVLFLGRVANPRPSATSIRAQKWSPFRGW
jgi:serpin B